MNLYIKTENGQAKNHPAFEENIIDALGSIPESWESFVRVKKPIPATYQVLVSDEPTYEKIDGTWTDVWVLRDMTTEEKSAVQQQTINDFRNREQADNWAAWVLDEATCTMQSPIPRPEPDLEKLNSSIYTFWCGAENNWKDTPVRPDVKKEYKFDFFAWDWVLV